MEVVLRAIAAAFGERPTAGIFHSLSTTVSLLHSDRYAWPWDALILIDPPVAPPPDHPLRPLTSHNEMGLSHWARQRQNHFGSQEELAEHFRRARRMRRWVAGAADLMARSITRAAEAGWELVCPPGFEAAIYLQNASAPIWPILERTADKLLVISADPTARDAGGPSQVCACLPEEFGIAVVTVPDSGHLLQIEHPEAVAAIVRDHLRAKGVLPA
jgi:pimeloyl-ACP methyl ester carboxylesterase